jgi:hypothetical protein
MKLWPWLTLAVAVIITRMSKEKDKSKPVAATTVKSTVRGIRNNNPGNLIIGDKWLGRIEPNTDGKFLQFKTMPYGVRALNIDLVVKHKRGLRTIQDIIYTYAPPSENDTKRYIEVVSKAMNIGAMVPFKMNLTNLNAFVKAIVRHECGPAASFVTASDYAAGLAMARMRSDINEYIKIA